MDTEIGTSSTPIRRSKRGQPLIHSKRINSSDVDISWVGACVYRRPTVSSDLYEDEWRKDIEMETLFYHSFTKTAPVAGKRFCGKGQKKEDPEYLYGVGDPVLVRSSPSKTSIGVITSMWEIFSGDTGEDRKLRVKVHWFLRPTELPSIRAKREHFQNEIFYSLTSYGILTPEDIVSRCVISASLPESAEVKTTLAWSVSPTKSRQYGRSGLENTRGESSTRSGPDEQEFYCRFAVDSKRGLFYDFDWMKLQKDAMEKKEKEWQDPKDQDRVWDALPIENPKRKKTSYHKPGPGKRRRISRDHSETSSRGDEDEDYELLVPSDEDDELSTLTDVESTSAGEELDSQEEVLPKTPSKKRKSPAKSCSPSKRLSKLRPQQATPRRVRTIVVPTPHSKAALRSRARKQKGSIRAPPAQFASSLQNASKLPKDPWLRAMHVLHVGARPDALPCREEEFSRILRSVDELLEEGSGGCIYISGVPGTGKTATVHATVRELKRLAEHNETNPFTYVEINGLKISEPSSSYSLLWEAISGHDTAREGHMKVSAKEALKQLTRHFTAGTRAGPAGHAHVVLMDELDQLVTSKQDVVYNFFDWPSLPGSKLVVIAVANTMDLPERVMSGRVRSRLGMIRINFQPYTTPQLEKIVHARLQSAREDLKEKDEMGDTDVITSDGIKFAAMKVSSISGDARRILDICRRAVELVQPKKRAARTEDVKQVITAMHNSPTAAFLRQCSFHERLMLAAVIKCVKRDGVEEVMWREVQKQHFAYMSALAGPDDSLRKPSSDELGFVLDSLVASHALLFEDSLAVSRKDDGSRRLMLNLEQGEIERTLSEVGGLTWKSVLSA